VRASKYGAYDSPGVLGLVPVRETAPLLLTFAMKAFWKEAVGVSEGGGSYVWEGGGYALGKAVGSGVRSGSEETP